MAVKGYGGVIKVGGEGMVKWKIQDDDLKKCFIIIHRVNYVPKAPNFLLWPNRWDQQSSDNHKKLTEHGVPPRPRTAPSTGSKRGTYVPHLGTHLSSSG